MTLSEPLSLSDMIEYARSEIREVTPLQAFASLDDFTVVDVREADEVLLGFLPDAIHIPRGQLELRAAEYPLLRDKDRLVLLYSDRGRRAAMAAYSLALLGHSNVASLRGGLDAWRQANLRVA